MLLTFSERLANSEWSDTFVLPGVVSIEIVLGNVIFALYVLYITFDNIQHPCVPINIKNSYSSAVRIL
jgi:hypothetical protein